jgi:hypothetical protein
MSDKSDAEKNEMLRRFKRYLQYNNNGNYKEDELIPNKKHIQTDIGLKIQYPTASNSSLCDILNRVLNFVHIERENNSAYNDLTVEENFRNEFKPTQIPRDRTEDEKNFKYLLWCISLNKKKNGVYFWKIVDEAWCNKYIQSFDKGINPKDTLLLYRSIADVSESVNPQGEQPPIDQPTLDNLITGMKQSSQKGGRRRKSKSHKKRRYYKYLNQRKSKKNGKKPKKKNKNCCIYEKKINSCTRSNKTFR